MPEFTSIGGLLRYLPRRARLTQRELGLAVGYIESHISRLDQDQRRARPGRVCTDAPDHALNGTLALYEPDRYLIELSARLFRVRRPLGRGDPG